MRHKLLLSLTLTASVSTALLIAGCSAEPILPSKSEEYSREFIKNFGVFDQAHDWNHATRTSVTVTTSTPTDIKVCANFNGKLYSFGEYKNVDGKQTLNVDVPKGTTDLIVRANGQNKSVKAGGEVNLKPRGSRIVWEHGQDGKGPFDVTITENRIFRTPEEVLRYREFLPEKTNNVGKVTQDFMFVSQGPFYIYPAYYQTDQYLSNIIGVYYQDENNQIVTQDFFRLGDGKLMMYTAQETETEGSSQYYAYQLNEGANNYIGVPSKATKFVDFTDEDWEFLREELRNGRLYFDGNADFKIFTEFSHEFINNDVIIRGKYKKYSTVYSSNQSIPEKAVGLAFQAIKIDIPVGQKFGMYIKLDKKMGQPDWGIDPKHTYFFSDSELNTDYLWLPKEGSDITTRDEALGNPDLADYFGADSKNPIPAVHAATFTREDGMIRLCFEDWYNTQVTRFDSDFDLNDMVFYISGVIGTEDNPTVVPDDPEPEPETWEWIIACEDLGTNDFDFNDVVFSVSGVEADVKTDTKTVTVKALASGGTLPVYIYYDGKMIVPDGADNGEFHSWFGDGSYSTTTVINASGLHADGKTATVTVPADFTMECCLKVTEGESGNMGGFKVEVKHLDGSSIIQATNPNIDSEIGTAPQMICVPGTWHWPTENTHIRTVYEDFVNWCANGHDASLNWHENRAPSGYWKR